MNEEYLEEIALNPFLTLDGNIHGRSRRAAFLKALDDFLDEYDELPLFLMGLPLLVLAELSRDDPINTTSSSSYSLPSIILSIVLHLYRVAGVLASTTPLLLFIISTTPELLAQQSRRLQVYYGPSITELLPQEVIDNIIDNLVPDLEHDHQICGSTHDKYKRSHFVRAFSAYSLVCSAFVRRSQFHLFSTLVVQSSSTTDMPVMNILDDGNTSAQRLRALAQFVEREPHLAQHIMRLQLASSPWAYLNARNDEHTQIRTLLEALHTKGVQVQTLCLGFNFRQARPLITGLASLFSPFSLLSRVTCLHLHEVVDFPPSFITMFPSLRALSLSDFRTTSHHVPGDVRAFNAHTRPQLHSLVLKLASCELLRVMGMAQDANGGQRTPEAAFLDLSKLAHCQLEWTNDEDQSRASADIVKTFGSAITQFTYRFRCLPESPDENFVNLGYLPILQELTVLFEPIWGMHVNRTRLARTRRGICPSTPSIDFLPWFMGNLHPTTSLQTLNITCPYMSFLTGDPDPASLILSLDWPRLDAEIHRIYGNIVTHNPTPAGRTRLTVNVSLAMPLKFPGGVSYKNGVETHRAERLRWTEKAARKCRYAMGTALRKQFRQTLRCPGIELNISYSLDIPKYPETRYSRVDN